MYIDTLLAVLTIAIYFSQVAQIALLLADKAFVKALFEYFDYIDVFLPEVTTELSWYTNINDHAINLEDDKQLYYKPIYSLGLIKPETLKIYIKANLKNGFI